MRTSDDFTSAFAATGLSSAATWALGGGLSFGFVCEASRGLQAAIESRVKKTEMRRMGEWC
jgi:hypothetical protein